MPHQREEWTHQPCGAVVTDMEESDSEDKDRGMNLIIYPEDSGDKEEYPHEPPSDPLSTEHTS